MKHAQVALSSVTLISPMAKYSLPYIPESRAAAESHQGFSVFRYGMSYRFRKSPSATSPEVLFRIIRYASKKSSPERNSSSALVHGSADVIISLFITTSSRFSTMLLRLNTAELICGSELSSTVRSTVSHIGHLILFPARTRKSRPPKPSSGSSRFLFSVSVPVPLTVFPSVVRDVPPGSPLSPHDGRRAATRSKTASADAAAFVFILPLSVKSGFLSDSGHLRFFRDANTAPASERTETAATAAAVSEVSGAACFIPSTKVSPPTTTV